MTWAYLYKWRQNIKPHRKIFPEYNMPPQIFMFLTSQLPLPSAINEEVLLLYPWTTGNSEGETHFSMTRVVPDRLSLGIQQRAVSYTMTLLTRVPGDTGLENYSVKKWHWVPSIVFQADLVRKENSIQQLCCTQAFHVRVQTWSFLWSNKNIFALVITNALGNWNI